MQAVSVLFCKRHRAGASAAMSCVRGSLSRNVPALPVASSHSVHPGQCIMTASSGRSAASSDAMFSRSRSDQEPLQTMMPLNRKLLMATRAADMLVAVTNSNPAPYNSDCVTQSSAVRLVITRTLEQLDIEPGSFWHRLEVHAT